MEAGSLPDWKRMEQEGIAGQGWKLRAWNEVHGQKVLCPSGTSESFQYKCLHGGVSL